MNAEAFQIIPVDNSVYAERAAYPANDARGACLAPQVLVDVDHDLSALGFDQFTQPKSFNLRLPPRRMAPGRRRTK